jgi:hypothetical protein
MKCIKYIVPVSIACLITWIPTPVMAGGGDSGSEGGSPDPKEEPFTPSYSDLTYPSCDGLCSFAVGRVSKTNNIPAWEALTGVVFKFGGAERRRGSEAARRQTEAAAKYNEALAQSTLSTAKQTDDTSIIDLSNKLAESIKNKQTEQTKVIAMALYQRLGYSSYQSFLNELGIKT